LEVYRGKDGKWHARVVARNNKVFMATEQGLKSKTYLMRKLRAAWPGVRF
jgi:uncharacterized protein YegP (UPF0339 family)